jgi:hypothetical protein
MIYPKISGENRSTLPSVRTTPRISAGWTGLACDTVREEFEWNIGRRDGLGQNHPNNCTAGTFGMRQGRLGSPSDNCAHIRDTQLGNGAEEMVSFTENSNLFWYCERAGRETEGLLLMFDS